jgi:AraC-like DNA-binding protein
MERDTLAGFAEAPTGRYVAGATFAHFCAEPTVWGVLLWGRPTREDIAALVGSLALELGPPAEPHGSVVDCSRLESVDAAAFGVLDAYVRSHLEPLARQVTRLALVRPEGIAGAVVAGFFEVLPRPYPVQVFAAAEPALAWVEAREPAALAATLDAVHRAATGSAPIVVALAALLDRHLVGMSVTGAAKELGLSERTLQRRLSEAGTSFLDELNAARLRAAQRLLVDSDAPITTIALEVGCATPQHFSALFRRATGLTPSEWRKEQRSPRA